MAKFSILVMLIVLLGLTASSSAVRLSSPNVGGVSGQMFAQANPPFDLFGTNRDANNLLRQPKWVGQSAADVFPDALDLVNCPNRDFSGSGCSSMSREVDTPKPPKSLICALGGAPKERAKGHVNWEPATYQGMISFGNTSDDFDWTWNFKPLNREGLTKQNHGSVKDIPEYIHAEFDSRETVDGFLTATWSSLRDGLECFDDEPGCAQQKAAARELLNGKRAIITGLLGLDTEHGGYSELHPVYAMAVEVNPDPVNNIWILFIRNRGNEGFCSRRDHPLPTTLTKFSLQIPKPPTSVVSAASFTAETSFSSTIENNCPALRYDPATQSAVVEFNLLKQPVGRPSRGPMLEGEVHIQWTLQQPFTPVRIEPSPVQFADDDEHFLTKEQRKQYILRMRAEQSLMIASSPGFHACGVPFSPQLLMAPTSKGKRKVVSPQKIQAEIDSSYRVMVRELCRASGNTLAGCNRWRRSKH
jgi:hypothetical protein